MSDINYKLDLEKSAAIRAIIKSRLDDLEEELGQYFIDLEKLEDIVANLHGDVDKYIFDHINN